MLGLLLLVWAGTRLSHCTDDLARPNEVKQYCEDNTFRATCKEEEAVVIEYARYGRMNVGKCISEHINMGCAVDVKDLLDRWCSGKQQCEIQVSQLIHGSIKPCKKDYRSYLEASYTCVKVMTGPVDGCYGGRPLEYREKEGYVSSQVARMNGCGSIDNPWQIKVGSGQRINITLYDFSMSLLRAGGRTESHRRPTSGSAEICLVYAIIKDATHIASASTTVCGGRSRISHVYTSVSNSVQVRLVTKTKDGLREETQFMLKYEAIGCADPDLGHGAWFERKGDTARVGCEGETDSLPLTCDGKQWKGKMVNCSSAVSVAVASSTGNALGKIKSIPNGMSIVIIVGVALCVGLFILLIGVVCLRRIRNREERRTPSYAPRDVYGKETSYGTPSQGSSTLKSRKDPMAHDDGFRNKENDYYRTWQLLQHQPSRAGSQMESLPPPPYHPISNSGYSSNSERYLEHVYESPKFERRDFSHVQQPDLVEEDAHVKYFELDPEAVSRRQAARTGSSGDLLGTGPPAGHGDIFLMTRT